MIPSREMDALRNEGEVVASKIAGIERAALDALREEKKQLSERIHKKAKLLFGEECKEVFAQHPKLEKFSWKQYTPYFNDGDECVFSVRNDYIDVAFGGEEFEEVSGWTFRKDNTFSEAEKAKAAVGLEQAFHDIRELLSTLEEDDYKLMFGDHVKVLVKAPGEVTTDDYSHD